jgi:predicted acetylornithine/succinylornithine family transaminase
MTSKQVISRDQKSIQPTYARFPVALAKGKGAYVWDEDGKRYLDFMCGVSVTNLGHCHPALTKAITGQAAMLAHTSNLFYQKNQVELAEALREAAPFASHVAFANTGAEANELLIKFARRFGAEHKRYEILAFHVAFHGRTFGALSASGQAKLQKGMEPLLPGFRHVPYNDLDAARKAVNRYTCAILVEPVQGENGVIPGSTEFLVGLRRLADRQGLLLMLDEIQTGLGRTGAMFAHEHMGHDCVPDVMSLAKSLGGGLPLSAVLVGERAVRAIGLGEHGTTLGGNPIACAAGLALLKELKAKKLPENAAKMGALLMDGLRALQSEFPGLIAQVRGKGLMIGVLLNQPSKPVALACLEHGLIVNSTAESVLRLLPPLNITPVQVKEALAILKTVLAKSAVQKALLTKQAATRN